MDWDEEMNAHTRRTNEDIDSSYEVFLSLHPSDKSKAGIEVFMGEKWREINSQAREDILQAILKLPQISPIEGWQTSFSEYEEGTWWCTTVINDMMSERHNGMVMSQFAPFFNIDKTRHPPPVDWLLVSLSEAMLHPVTPSVSGAPHRPVQLFFAHR
jgi:hypothetical protein